MLSTQTILPDTLELLIKLQKIPELHNFRLVGGTSLALQLGHRFSIDLDLFSYCDAIPTDIQTILFHHGLRVENISLSERIKIFKVNEIKVDFVNYGYPWLSEAICEDSITIASIDDIAPMKLSAITNRGTKKDFVDLYFLLDRFAFPDILGLYHKKYPDASDFLLYKSLVYFDDAEHDPMPRMFQPVSWDQVKKRIMEIADRFFLT